MMQEWNVNYERIESEAEEAVEKAEQKQDRESNLLQAIRALGDDVSIRQLLEKRASEAGQERAEAERELDQLRNRANEMQDYLCQLQSDNCSSADVLRQLQELGEDVSEGVALLEERQMMIDHCTEVLQRVMEMLGLSSGNLDKPSFGASGGGNGGTAEAAAELPPEEERKSPAEQFRNSLKAEIDSKPVSSCCGVLTHGALPSGYEQMISSRIAEGTPDSRKLFLQQVGKLVIQNSENPVEAGAYYAPMTTLLHPRGVYYNAAADAQNLRGAGTTYFHELGHMIDHVAVEGENRLSQSEAFKNALVADGRRVKQFVSGMNETQRETFLNGIRKHTAHSCSDLLDAVTDGEIHGWYGHERDYWRVDGNLQAEAFAHFFEASMGCPSKERLLRNVFPNAYREYDRLVRTALDAGDYREKERQVTDR